MDHLKSHSGVKRKKVSYYGGDKVNYDDEVSHKLYSTDCRRRQADLYPAYLFKSIASRMLLTAPTPGEMMVSSGQSRLHLYIGQKFSFPNKPELNISAKKKSFVTKQDISCNSNTDFLLFSVRDVVFPNFPTNLEDEADSFRSHGFPLFVWPDHLTTKSAVQQYLSDNYPDCAYCFKELDKVTAWLEQKWVPLAKSIGQFEEHAKGDEETETRSIIFSQVSKSSDVADSQAWILNVPKDSVAASYCRQRLAFYQKYASMLRSYLVHRRSFTPGFQYNSIHQNLREMAELRSASLPNDSGFFNVIGNHFLKAAKSARLDGKALDLNAHKFTASLTDIADENTRRQCLRSLLSAKALRTVIARAGNVSGRKTKRVKKKRELTNSNRDSDPDASDASSVQEESGEAELQEQNPRVAYPNRPITKEIMENRGLVKYRHKRERNPRVHLRHKFHKATVRYRSRVAPARTEETPYSGEIKGIRVHLVKSHKFKRPK